MDANTLAWFIIALVALAQYVGLKSSSIPLKLMAAFSWLMPFALMAMYPPTSIVKGGGLDNIIIVICLGIGLIEGFWAFRKPLQVTNTSKDKNGNINTRTEEHEGWHFPAFMTPNNEEKK